MSGPQIKALSKAVQPLREQLLAHPIFHGVQSKQQLQRFMEIHTFAVWDFMSLTKRLQRDLTCVTLPWVPVPSATLARFINEVVTGEESDTNRGDGYVSHYTLYIDGMKEMGADTTAIEKLVNDIIAGKSVDQAMAGCGGPKPAVDFTQYNLDLAATGSTAEVASAFVFGREDLIPDMFQRLLDDMGDVKAPTFRYYLERHIEIDGEDHGPMSLQLLEHVCGTEEAKWSAAEASAKEALTRRIELWDATHAYINAE